MGIVLGAVSFIIAYTVAHGIAIHHGNPVIVAVTFCVVIWLVGTCLSFLAKGK